MSSTPPEYLQKVHKQPFKTNNNKNLAGKIQMAILKKTKHRKLSKNLRCFFLNQFK